MPIAAHTVTLTPGGIVVVIGGVSTDLAIQNRVMAYSVHTDSWEIWPHEILQISGVYIHVWKTMLLLFLHGTRLIDS